MSAVQESYPQSGSVHFLLFTVTRHFWKQHCILNPLLSHFASSAKYLSLFGVLNYTVGHILTSYSPIDWRMIKYNSIINVLIWLNGGLFPWHQHNYTKLIFCSSSVIILPYIRCVLIYQCSTFMFIKCIWSLVQYASCWLSSELWAHWAQCHKVMLRPVLCS